MYKYETLAMDGDGNYYAIFKHTNKQFDRLIYDLPGLLYIIERKEAEHIDIGSLHVARVNLHNRYMRRKKKERAI